MMRLTFCVNMFGKSHERTGVKMATANQVFEAKVSDAFDASIESLKKNHAVYPDVEMLKCMAIVFYDGITFGLDSAKEVSQQFGKGI